MTDSCGRIWASFDEILEELNEAIQLHMFLRIDFLQELLDSWVENEFEMFHGFALPETASISLSTGKIAA